MDISRENKKFLRLAAGVAIPIALQQFVTSALNMLDVLMIGRLGEKEIAGCGLANQIFFVYTLLCFGILSGASIFMAQDWGRGHIRGIHRAMGISLVLCCLAGTAFTFGGALAPDALLSLFSKDAEVISIGAKYLRIVSASYIIYGITQTFGFSLRSIGKTTLPMAIAIMSFLCNAFLNAILIFGLLGFPAMGVAGAAIATLISRILEIIVMLAMVFRRKMPVAAKFSGYLDLRAGDWKNFISTAGFVMLNESLWGLGISLYNAGYKYSGTSAQAAVQICSNIQNLFFVVTIGIGSAAAIILGNLIGAKKPGIAESYAKKFFKVTAVSGASLGLLMYVSRPFALSFFDVSGEVYMYAERILTVYSIYIIANSFNHLIIVGVLRSGGDTRFCMILDCMCVWLFGIPMAFIGSALLNLPIYHVVALVMAENIIKLIFGTNRVRTGKWINSVNG